MKKNVLAVFLAISVFWASGVYAADTPTPTPTGYEPLVKIPGVPDGVVDISKYIIGIYDFLLSIVGIVAVAMLIIGGMKYITAAGSGGAVSSAKETIKDALLGLVLALLSAVIVSTINPDVLYLRQPGAALTKDNIDYSSVSGTFTTNEDGTVTYTSLEGYESKMSKETAAQIKAGTFKMIFTVKEKAQAMKKNLYCIAPGSPSGNSDPSYRQSGGKCTCITGNQVILPEGKTDCNATCEAADSCGYKFLAIKLNARHGYTKVDGTVDSSADSGSVETTTADPPEYDLTNDAQVHSDEIWEMTGTNDPTWGDFNIVYATTERWLTLQHEYEEVKLDAPRRYEQTDTDIYPCAILVTNDKENSSDDQHFVYWVPLGTTVGENKNLFTDIKGGYKGGCEKNKPGYYNIVAGTCDQAQAWTDRVMLAKYSDKVTDKCTFCALAEGEDEKIYRFKKTYTCKSGYWQ